MIGLALLAVAVLWLGLSLWLALKLPTWLRVHTPVRRIGVTAAALVALLVGPFVDEIVGMRQFENLCAERAIVKVSPEADRVRRAVDANLPMVELPGHWIKIRSQRVAYIDLDTGKIFLTYEILHTSGGRIAGVLLFGGNHSCAPQDYSSKRHLDIDQLLKNGKGL